MDRQKSSGGGGDAPGVTHEVRNDTLHVCVRGSVDLPAITAYATRHQDVWPSHAKILWDLRKFDPSGISSKDILNIPHAFAEIMNLRAGGRSAVLVSKELELVTRVAMALFENQPAQIELRSFLDEAVAKEWLDEI